MILYTHICIYIYTHMHTHTYICIYIYIERERERERGEREKKGEHDFISESFWCYYRETGEQKRMIENE
jgi:hypothetical protein